MYLKISNTGNVPVQAFSLVGASTKRDNKTKIGMFGSGNKYAIAYLFRNNYDFKVITGEGEIKFTTIKTDLNGVSFDVICINGKETSITTEMGPKWSLWQSIREIYSNAKDEGMTGFGLVDNIETEYKENETNIYIELKDDLRDMYENIGDYFAINKEVLFECEFGKIYKKDSPNTCIYRKGIRCYDTEKQSVFDYDFNTIPINENRVIEYSWDLPQQIWELLYQCDNDYVIRSILNKLDTKNILETNIDDSFVTTYSSKISDSWAKGIENSKIAPKVMSGYVKESDVAKTILLPTKLYHDLVSKFGDEVKPESFKESKKGVHYSITDVNELQIQMLKDVTEFFDQCKFEIGYKINIVSFNNPNIHGCIENGDTILIAKNAFEKGKTWIANIIIEEYIHLKFDAEDETRKFQDDAIGVLITYMKTINSFNL